MTEILFLSQSDDSDNDDGANSEENFSEDEVAATANAYALKQASSKTSSKETVPKRKRKSCSDEATSSSKQARCDDSPRKEQQHPPVPKKENESSEKSSKSTKTKKEGAGEIIWNDRNCDIDLDDQAASNVHFRKIKISNNLIISCKMISHLENKNLHQDYAALVFSRKTNKDRTFDFLIDMRVTERLIKALQIVIDENPVFFNKKPQPALTRSS